MVDPLIERACAWLREPPDGAAIVVVGPRFAILRDDDAVLAYELPPLRRWHEGGVTIDDMQRALSRVLWREPIHAAFVEVDTRHGVIVIAPSLDAAALDLEDLSLRAALVCGRRARRAGREVVGRANVIALEDGPVALAVAGIVDGRVLRP